LRCTNLGILATAHNTVENITIWVNAFIKLKARIEQNSFRKKQRPWFGKFDTTGTFCVSVKSVEAATAAGK